jgi:putative DNA methylase
VTYKKKLIEVALPLAAINKESSREKTIRHGHPSTLHLWWARRPSATALAVLFGSLIDDPSENESEFPTLEAQALERKRLFEILERLIPWDARNNSEVLDEVRFEIQKNCVGGLPNILDPFGGGGSIPLEAMRLGLPTFSGDLNPVAVMIQRAMLELPHRFKDSAPLGRNTNNPEIIWKDARGLAADVEHYALELFKNFSDKCSSQYGVAIDEAGVPRTVIGWFWARTVKSPDASWGGHVPLVKSWTLVNKAGKEKIWIKPEVDYSSKTISYKIKRGGEPDVGTIDRGNGVCIATGTAIPGTYIKDEANSGRMSEVLIAIIAESQSGRMYLSPDRGEVRELVEAPAWIAEGNVPRHLTGGTCAVYGLDAWEKLFLDRQKSAIKLLCDELGLMHERIENECMIESIDKKSFADGGHGCRAYADAVVTYLAFIVDRCIGRWNSLSIWNTSAETIEHVFRRQSLPMTWEFVEANPFSDSSGSFKGQIEWVAKYLNASFTSEEGHVQQMDAVSRIRNVGKCVISTDPPYYDNISYSDLSDFYYVWLKKMLAKIWPNEFATLLTPKAEELIANTHRAGSKALAVEHFENGMKSFFQEAIINADERFPTTIYYAYKASEGENAGNVSTGWEIFLKSLLESNFAVTATWPMRTEMVTGIKSNANMLATSIVIACRKRSVSAALATRGEFISALRNEMAQAIRILQVENIAPVDMAQSAIGPGIGIFSRYSKVVEADGSTMTVRTALSLINEVLAEVLSGEESEFDADTRFAVTWFEQFGHSAGSFGDADTLAKAKNTTVHGVVEAGVAESKDGALRLLERIELSEKWDPSIDNRLTVWETTQYLIRALEESETKAAALIAKLGSGVSERARQLAYLLYGICDRKKWASEGSPYNMLVTAWPEIEKLARQTPSGTSTTETLF